MLNHNFTEQNQKIKSFNGGGNVEIWRCGQLRKYDFIKIIQMLNWKVLLL